MWIPADPQDPRSVAERILEFVKASSEDFEERRVEDAEVRAAQVSQAKKMAAGPGNIGFSSQLCQGLQWTDELQGLLEKADVCTQRVPSSMRRSVEAATALPLTCVGTRRFGKVYWHSHHKQWGWAAPLGKLHKQGLEVFEKHGWRLVQTDDTSLVPAFCWPTRKLDFPIAGATLECLPLVRPFPQEFTNRLDEKAQFARHLRDAGHDDVHPPTWTAEEFFQEHAPALGRQSPRPGDERTAEDGEETVARTTYEFETGEGEDGVAASDAGCTGGDDFNDVAAPEADDDTLWFLKHTMGVKGNAVYPFAGSATLLQRLQELGTKGRRTWVVQRGVSPPALRNGRKWVLRAHMLLLHGSVMESDADSVAQSGPASALRAYCHRDMIILEHGQPYTPQVDVRAAHISSAGHPKNWPKPSLLENEGLRAQVCTLAARAVAAVLPYAPSGPFAPDGAGVLCQVFGLDVVADADGRAWLLEVNSYPAIASGTMTHVDTQVYNTLVRDVLRLAVLPRLDGEAPNLGGFRCLDVTDFAPSA